MKDVAGITSHEWCFDMLAQAGIVEHQFILLSLALAPGRPFIKMRQLHPQHGGLQSIEPAVKADDFVMVFLLFAVHAQHAQPLSMIRIVGDQHSAVAGAAQVSLKGRN